MGDATLKLPRTRQILPLALLLLSVVCTGSETEPHVRVNLIAAVSSVAPGSTFDVVFRQEIDPGWHTYWKNPGDSGAPPSISWSAPAGVSVSEFSWPAPERIPYGPLMNFGYHDEVLLPFTVTVDKSFSEQELRISGSGRVLVCADICIPEKVEVLLVIPLGEQSVADPLALPVINAAQAAVPVTVDLPASVSRAGETLLLDTGLPADGSHRISQVSFFPDEPEMIDNPADQRFTTRQGRLQVELSPGELFVPGETQLSGVLVISESAGQALRSSYHISASQAVAGNVTANDDGLGVMAALLFAFLGGMILNLMPCVFPVLSIKILSLVASSGEGSAGRHGLVYALGVVVSFVLIAMLLILLRAGGEAIGWGFQLQSPLVVGLLAYLFVLIALNLLGVFEIGTSLMGLGGGGGGTGMTGSFSTGVLATLVAAPCTAPFMGAAVGFALAQPAWITASVFASLGLGMAVPFVFLSFSPGLVRRLPRPGPWMQVLKQLLAFPMLGSAVWLAWVLGLQAGVTGMMQLLAGALLIGLGTWAYGRRPGRPAGLLILATCLVLAFLLLLRLPEPTPADALSTDVPDGLVVAYSEENLARAREQGAVFVNFTAAWCITCKVNELNALTTDAVQQAFRDKRITYMKGDWTSENPVITRALERYGRGGVPLYLYFGKGAEAAVVLPQLLTEGIVLKTIEEDPV